MKCQTFKRKNDLQSNIKIDRSGLLSCQYGLKQRTTSKFSFKVIRRTGEIIYLNYAFHIMFQR